ncbi:hypothetical protein [Paraburkholderia strydomiana]|uniref:Uncharacterized protein n=1 Tax=Paraburkholderia strydomiana TaxID=1245417 RepID=A0ABW9BTM2_9BURK
MTTINVQFADDAHSEIVSYFDSEQDSTAWPNQGTVDSSDPRWKAYYEALSSMMQSGLPAPTAS